MLYHYVASDASGKIVESDIDADSLNHVLHALSSKELRPVSVKPLAETRSAFRFFLGKITLADKVFLCKYLALMLKVGTDLLSAINILIADFEKPVLKNFFLEVRENLDRGQPFYKAFEARRKVFSPTFVNLVKAAEVSGNLQKTFEDLSESLIREATLRNKIRSALVYPIMLLGASLAIVTFLVTFALPRIAKVFLESGINPPRFSKVVFGIGLFANNHIVFLITSFCVAAALVLFTYYRTWVGKQAVEAVLTRTPFLRGIYRDLAVQRISYTVGSLIKAGLPIIDSIKISADTVGLAQFRYGLLRVADEWLSKGLTLGEAFKREAIFPKVFTNLVVISEKGGHLEEVLGTLADFYAARVDSSIKTLVSLLEPSLLLLMGFIVATISLSIIVPVYQLTSQF